MKDAAFEIRKRIRNELKKEGIGTETESSWNENQESISEFRAQRLRIIKEKFNLPDKGSLYYPACGEDNSPSLAFPRWSITYLDARNDNIDKSGEDVQFLKGDLLSPPFDRERTQFDVAMLVSPGNHFSSYTPEYIEKVVQYLRVGGLLLCDDYHDTASYIEKNMKDALVKEEIEDTGEFTVFMKST